MKNHFLVSMVVLSSFLLSCLDAENAKIQPKAVKGILDLGQWNLRDDGPVKLDGTWLFFKDRFLSQEDLKVISIRDLGKEISVPADWTKQTVDGKKLTARGYGTYYLKLLMNESDDPLALKFPTVGAAFECFINGKKIASAGKTGKTAEDMIARYKPQVADFAACGKEVDILIRVSNFQQNYGGLWYSLSFGRAGDLYKEYRQNLTEIFFLGGIFFIMFLYHMVLLAQRRKSRLALYFALFCLVLTVRIFSQGEFYFIQLFPGMSFKVQLTLRYLTFYLAVPAIAAFLWESFKKEYSKVVLYSSVILGVLFSVFFVAAPLSLATRTLPVYQIISVLQMVYGIFILALAIKRKREGAIVLGIGALLFALTAVNDMLYANFVIKTGYIFGWGLLMLIFSQSVLLSTRFSRAFTTVESLSCELEEANVELQDLNQNLEKKVHERTEELQAAYEEMAAINGSLKAARDSLWGEMQLAKKIQTVLLPDSPVIPGYEIAALMVPADDVGGDYYDIINVEGIDWIVIGDVSGHGVPAGLIMMMVQTAIHSILEHNPKLHPSELLSLINRTIRKNISKLSEDKYMTITVLAAFREGEFTFSGLHQDILIYRSEKGEVDVVETDGFWIGIYDEIGHMLRDDTLHLDKGDVMLLFTDGITEAWEKGAVMGSRRPETDMYGGERLAHVFKSSGQEDADAIIRKILASLGNYAFDDDLTIVVVRRLK